MTNLTKLLFFILLSLFTTNQLASKTKKVIYVVVDGIPADYIERVKPKTIFEIAQQGGYARAYTGGEVGGYSQTATISAIGYMNILTGTWFNKHNVHGNSNLKPNYNYWSMFRIAKEQQETYKTALFSSWVDNRTVLIGEGKAETNHLKIDYIFDDYEQDTLRFPKNKGGKHLEIFDIDSVVCKEAAQTVRNEAPDLSWVYLWYTDSGFHLYGDGAFMDEYVHKTDDLIRPIWEAVQYREKNFDEEWMMIVTTDHGREETGHSHGGQAERERSCWVSTNHKDINSRFHANDISLVDINPSICRFMGFELPQAVSFEQDGIPFIGKVDIKDLRTTHFDQSVTLHWESITKKEKATIYVATSNHYKEGKEDKWIKLGEVAAKDAKYTVDLSNLPESKFYKFVVQTPNNQLNRWIRK
ncbi:MAG: alkaline phosphatase family protein [Phocaeicola sp.]